MVHSNSLQLHFLALFKSLHVKIPDYVAKLLGIHHLPDNDPHVQWKVCEGASMFIVFWLNYQVGIQSTDCFAPHPFLNIYVSNKPPKQHKQKNTPNMTPPPPQKKIPFSSNPHTPPAPSKKRINKITKWKHAHWLGWWRGRAIFKSFCLQY